MLLSKGPHRRFAAIGGGKSFVQDKSTARTLSHKGLYSQIQRVLATDIQDFILTPLLTCHVTLGATTVHEKPQFLQQRSPAQKHSIRTCSGVSQSLQAIPGQRIVPPLCHHQSLSCRCFHRTPTTSHAMQHQPIIRRSRRQNSCTPIPINN